MEFQIGNIYKHTRSSIAYRCKSKTSETVVFCRASDGKGCYGYPLSIAYEVWGPYKPSKSTKKVTYWK